MKKIDRIMDAFDYSINRYFGVFFKRVGQHFAVFSASVLLVLMIGFFVKVINNKPYLIASIVSSDLKKISYALKLIDKECKILSVNGGRTTINFLNVKKFAGSVVGGVDLVAAEKWQGPYLEVNPTLQQHYYELVLAADGYYILPGRGVVLPNGYTVGKDFDITNDVVVDTMLKPDGFLYSKGGALALKIDFKIKDAYFPVAPLGQEFVSKKIEKINSFVNEFNEALPFTKNEQTRKAV